MTSLPPIRNSRSYTTMAAAIVIAAVVLAGGIVAATYVGKSTVTNTTTSTAVSTTTATTTVTVLTATATTSLDTTFTTNFYYSININYSGSWNLVYWGENGTVPQNSSTIPGRNPTYVPWQYNIKEDLNGTGNYNTTIVTYGVGYVENMLCAQATRLDSQGNLTLTLTVVNQSNSTTTSNPSAEACATFGV